MILVYFAISAQKVIWIMKLSLRYSSVFTSTLGKKKDYRHWSVSFTLLYLQWWNMRKSQDFFTIPGQYMLPMNIGLMPKGDQS